MKSKNIRILTRTAVFVSLIAICAQISVVLPIGVSLTLQTFAVSLCGYFLPATNALTACGVYVLLGAVGAPVFSSFSGGIAIILGKSGGYIIGFFAIAFFCSLSVKFRKWPAVFFPVLGILICHLLGIIWLTAVSGVFDAKLYLTFTAVFLIKDITFVFTARYFSHKLNKVIKI